MRSMNLGFGRASLGFWLVAAICLGLGLYNLPPARAQGAGPSGAALPADFAFVEYTPWLVVNKGPAASKGVIYFVWGWNRLGALDRFHLPPYLLTDFNRQGWDVITAKVPESYTGKIYGPNLGAAAVPLLRQAVTALRAKGYRRVVVAGHGWGALTAMEAAQNGGLAADALVLNAPGGGGGPAIFLSGQPNPDFDQGVANTAAAMDDISIPTILTDFGGDAFDKHGVTGAAAEHSFTQRNLPHIVIVDAPGFYGHFAAWTPFFDFVYGKCLESFLEAPATRQCPLPPISNADFRSILNLQQIADPDAKRVTAMATLTGHSFFIYTVDDGESRGGHDTEVSHYDFQSPTLLLNTVHNEAYSVPVSFEDGRFCLGDDCRVLLQWSDRQLLEFNAQTGKIAAWWVKEN